MVFKHSGCCAVHSYRTVKLHAGRAAAGGTDALRVGFCRAGQKNFSDPTTTGRCLGAAIGDRQGTKERSAHARPWCQARRPCPHRGEGWKISGRRAGCGRGLPPSFGVAVVASLRPSRDTQGKRLKWRDAIAFGLWPCPTRPECFTWDGIRWDGRHASGDAIDRWTDRKMGCLALLPLGEARRRRVRLRSITRGTGTMKTETRHFR